MNISSLRSALLRVQRLTLQADEFYRWSQSITEDDPEFEYCLEMFGDHASPFNQTLEEIEKLSAWTRYVSQQGEYELSDEHLDEFIVERGDSSVVVSEASNTDFFDYSTFDSFDAINMLSESNPQLEESIVFSPPRVEETPSTILQSTVSSAISNSAISGDLSENYRLVYASDESSLSSEDPVAKAEIPSSVESTERESPLGQESIGSHSYNQREDLEEGAFILPSILQLTVGPATAIPTIFFGLWEAHRAAGALLLLQLIRVARMLHKPWT